ncbi:hypothetical protein ACQEU6_12580 [Spirillospora sp. CA-108201]
MDVSPRAIRSGDLGRLRVGQAVAAVLDGLLDLQEIVRAQDLDLVARGPVGAVALGAGRTQLGGDEVGAP